jgi:hypothetical protein
MSGMNHRDEEELSVLSERRDGRTPSPVEKDTPDGDTERREWEFLQRHVQMMAIGNLLLEYRTDSNRCEHWNWIAS